MSPIDRRQKRTHAALLAAFRDLVLERGYAQLTVGDIIARANVGRSTYYEHVDGKDGLLRESLEPFFARLAEAVDPATDMATMRSVLEHFWENRRVARALLVGAAGEVAHELLAQRLTEKISRSGQPASSLVPVSFMAAQVAAAQLGLIRTWLTGKTACDVATVTTALARTSVSLTRALTC
jgi:AcrR family transcriptional regulator